MNFHLLFCMPSLRFSISAIFRTSLSVILSCQRFLNIRLRHLLWKTLILFSSFLFIFHVSQPYIKTGFTSVLCSLTLVHRLMLLLLQIFFNFKNTPLALTTLLWMSSVPPPSLETVTPRYTNLSTSFIPRRFTSTSSLFLEFICSSLHLSKLTFSPTLSASCANLSVLVRMCRLVDEKRTISSAKSRSSSYVVNFHLILVFPSCNVFLITQLTTSRNSKPDMLQPCITPVLILNHSLVSCPSTTVHSKSA